MLPLTGALSKVKVKDIESPMYKERTLFSDSCSSDLLLVTLNSERAGGASGLTIVTNIVALARTLPSALNIWTKMVTTFVP